MGIEGSIKIPDPSDPNYEPKIVTYGTYTCSKYPSCKGKQVIKSDEGELKPCPKCGNRIMLKWH